MRDGERLKWGRLRFPAAIATVITLCGASHRAFCNDPSEMQRDAQIEGVAELVLRASVDGPGWVLLIHGREKVYELKEVFARGSLEEPILVRVGAEYVAEGSRLRMDADVEAVPPGHDGILGISRPRNVVVSALVPRSGGIPLLRCGNSSAGSSVLVDIEVKRGAEQPFEGYQLMADAYNSKGSFSERLESTEVELRLIDRKMVLDARGERGQVELALDRVGTAVHARGQALIRVAQGPAIEQEVTCAPAGSAAGE